MRSISKSSSRDDRNSTAQPPALTAWRRIALRSVSLDVRAGTGRRTRTAWSRWSRSCPKPEQSVDAWSPKRSRRSRRTARRARCSPSRAALRGEHEPAALRADKPGLLEAPRQLGERLERGSGVGAEQLADPFAGRPRRAPRARSTGRAAARGGRARRARRQSSAASARPSGSPPLDLVALGPSPCRAARSRRFATEAVDLPGEVHVAHQLLGERLELRPLLRASSRRSSPRRRPSGGPAARAARRGSAARRGTGRRTRSMNCSKLGSRSSPAARCSSIRLSASRPARRCSRSSGPLAATAPAVRSSCSLGELLAQLVEELLEALARLRGDELVA